MRLQACGVYLLLLLLLGLENEGTTMSYQQLLAKARETAASGPASESGDRRLASKGVSSKGRSRFVDEDLSGLMTRPSSDNFGIIGDVDFMTKMFNKVYASNENVAKLMEAGGFNSKEAKAMLGKGKDDSSEVEGSKEDLNFLDQLNQSESSGNSKSERTNKDGKKFAGAGNFGEERLDDARKALGISFTMDEFKNSPEIQKKVSLWHIKDIDKAIDNLGDRGKNYDRNGLRSVAHLGGIKGMNKYVKSGGQYNPKDELGTYLSDYYAKFSSVEGNRNV